MKNAPSRRTRAGSLQPIWIDVNVSLPGYHGNFGIYE